MELIKFALVGLIVGALAKLIVPGKQGGGILMTAALGCVGSLVGTFGGQALGVLSAQSGTNWIASIIGAVVVVWIYSLLTKKSPPST
ncbi:MAG: GlsB/YeaQ/YmgE family stress response membrane protein [Casimicrobiaceae bacterium]|nr:GlsB/YeaQ/YmgE family stress response membrane protein [Casimicrobiaceae bacterium]MCX8097538.1 GlsB/YeaQ/YmgE family stress response membrane protein [Casimicrobiaceae bacterium]MDW8312866.1 GlsB/YeaQ/YmgE family stress response membrane protein [Burkholderiales bacterium]